MRTAVVLAGGRSTRFGEADKALADLGGRPMIRRVADRLVTDRADAAVDELVVNCRADQRDAIADALDGYPLSVRYALDETPDEGPMAGIRTGLAAVADDDPEALVFVVACDMPFVDADVADYLFERAAAAGVDAAVPEAGGWSQPTQAVYRAGPTVDACQRALARGDRTVRAVLEELDRLVVDEAEIEAHGSLDTFENVNTREAFEAARRRF